MNVQFEIKDGKAGVIVNGEYYEAEERFYELLDDERQRLRAKLEKAINEVDELQQKLSKANRRELDLDKAESKLRMISVLIDH